MPVGGLSLHLNALDSAPLRPGVGPEIWARVTLALRFGLKVCEGISLLAALLAKNRQKDRWVGIDHLRDHGWDLHDRGLRASLPRKGAQHLAGGLGRGKTW